MGDEAGNDEAEGEEIKGEKDHGVDRTVVAAVAAD